jgi:hypothetical protein
MIILFRYVDKILFRVVNYKYVKTIQNKRLLIMKNSPYSWVTIKYQSHMFDVRFLNVSHTIHEIRPIDSEINILTFMDSNALLSIQNLIKESHHAI